MAPGTPPTLERIYRDYRRYVVQLVTQRAPLRYVDDLVQDCFLAMHRTLASYDPSQNLMPWIKTVVIRTVKDFLALHRIRNELLSVHGDVVDRTESFERSLIRRDFLDDLMASLDEDERRVAELVWVDKLGPDAIAAELGMTPGHAITLRRRGLAKLQSALRRHRLRERRVLGEPPTFTPSLAFFVCATPWRDRIRSAIARLFAHARAAITTLATSAALVIVLGAASAPNTPPMAPPPDTSPRTATLTAAWLPPPVPPSPAMIPIDAPPPPPALAPPAPLGESTRALLEQRSLERIRVTLDADPAAAIAALARHKKLFPRERLRDERQALEDLARAKLAPLPSAPQSDPRSMPLRDGSTPPPAPAPAIASTAPPGQT